MILIYAMALVLYVFLGVLTARYFRDDIGERDTEFAFLVVVFWPLVLAVYWIYKALQLAGFK